MKPKIKHLESSSHGFDSKQFWRHYVATVDTDEEWTQDRPQPGRGSNRLFLFLLLFHIFLIGSVVLFNLVAERPKPVFADASASKGASIRRPGGSEKQISSTAGKQGETTEHRVALGDSLKSIADASGVSQEEIAGMNQIEVTTQLAVGSVLRVPKPKPKPPVVPAVVKPERVENKILVQATTTPAGAAIFKAVEPAPSTKKSETAPAPAPKTLVVASKPPEEKSRPKPEDSPPPARKATAKAEESSSSSKSKSAATIAKVEETPPSSAKAKSTEAKALTRPESPPASSSKTSEPAKAAASGSSHTVKPKETFYSISRKYGVKVDDLMRLNNFTDPGKLREGVVLKVPK